MPPFLSSQTVLLFAMGITAYIGLLHVWHSRRWGDPSCYVALWSLEGVLFQVGRTLQLATSDPDVAVAVVRGFVSIAPWQVFTLCAFVHALAARPPLARTRLLPLLAANLALSIAIATTAWFIPGQTYLRDGAFGGTFLAVVGGAPLLVFPLYVAMASAWIWRQLRDSTTIAPDERNVLLASFGSCAAIGMQSTFSALRWLVLPPLAAFAPVVMALGLGFLMVRRRRRLEGELQALVDVRSAELRASEERYRGLIDNAPIGIIACDHAGQITIQNPHFRKMLRRPEDAPRGGANLLTNAHSVLANAVRRCLARDQVVTVEHSGTLPWGRRIDVRLVVAPLHDEQGAVMGALGIAEDDSERRVLEGGLRRAQRLESVGQLAAGIAHEINNPMAFVRTNLSVLREEWHALEKQLASVTSDEAMGERFSNGEALLDEALEGIERTIAIARDMREFAYIGSDSSAAVDLNPLVEGSVRIASAQCTGAIRVEEIYGDLPPVWGSAGQLRQVIVNLLVNAFRAVGVDGNVRVETSLEDGHAVLRVCDDGLGISPQQQQRIFDPFFTAGSASEGTGLGLYVAREIVRGHGGEIEVSSSPGQGARFEVRLPPAPDRQMEA